MIMIIKCRIQSLTSFCLWFCDVMKKRRKPHFQFFRWTIFERQNQMFIDRMNMMPVLCYTNSLLKLRDDACQKTCSLHHINSISRIVGKDDSSQFVFDSFKSDVLDESGIVFDRFKCFFFDLKIELSMKTNCSH